MVLYLDIFFYLGFTARQTYFIHFEQSQSFGGAKTGDTREKKKHLTTRKQNLACLTCDLSEAGTNSGEMTSDLDR